MLQKLSYQQDKFENRNHHNNIRIPGISESADPKDLPVAVMAIFNQLLQRPKDDPIELDRVHRTSDPSFVHDTLCRVPHLQDQGGHHACCQHPGHYPL